MVIWAVWAVDGTSSSRPLHVKDLAKAHHTSPFSYFEASARRELEGSDVHANLAGTGFSWADAFPVIEIKLEAIELIRADRTQDASVTGPERPASAALVGR
jgi:hypothetical protein